jgi:hypothetical protein
MASVIAHLVNDDPILGEIEVLPKASDSLITIKNPRRKDGKDLPYLEANVSTIVIPLGRISFVEVLESHEEEIITFVRE